MHVKNDNGIVTRKDFAVKMFTARTRHIVKATNTTQTNVKTIPKTRKPPTFAAGAWKTLSGRFSLHCWCTRNTRKKPISWHANVTTSPRICINAKNDSHAKIESRKRRQCMIWEHRMFNSRLHWNMTDPVEIFFLKFSPAIAPRLEVFSFRR